MRSSPVGRPSPERKRARTSEHSTLEVRLSDTVVAPGTRTQTKRPRLYKVILENDDYTPREFVVVVLKKVFRMSAEEAYRVMMTAHSKGLCIVAVYTKEIAEAKAAEATDLGRRAGHPLLLTIEPEE